MSRNRAYNRRMMWIKALRKKRISDAWGQHYYDNLHEYSKNKIHCSCHLCSTKTRNKGKRIRGNYDPSINYKYSDKKRIAKAEYKENF